MSSRRFGWIPATVALIVLTLLWGCSGPSVASPSASSMAPTPSPSLASSSSPASSSSFSTAPSSDPSADLTKAVAALKVGATSAQSIVAASTKTSGDWASIIAGPATNDPSHAVAPFTVVIGHRVDGKWQLVSESDATAFCAALAAAPSDLVTSDMRDYFVGCR